MFDKDSVRTINDGEYPFYSGEEAAPEKDKARLPSYHATSVNGIEAVTYNASGPNKLVATNNSGKLPIGTIQGASIPSFGSNALALAGGLTVGQFYRNTDGVSIVH